MKVLSLKNEGSLNYTLTSGAFSDNDGEGVPDGVTVPTVIIGEMSGEVKLNHPQYGLGVFN